MLFGKAKIIFKFKYDKLTEEKCKDVIGFPKKYKAKEKILSKKNFDGLIWGHIHNLCIINWLDIYLLISMALEKLRTLLIADKNLQNVVC